MMSRKQFVDDHRSNALKAHNIQTPSLEDIKQRFQNLIASVYPYKIIYDDVKTKQSLLDISRKPCPPFVSLDSLDQSEMEKVLVLQPIPKQSNQPFITRYQGDTVSSRPAKRQKRGPRKSTGKAGGLASSSSLNLSSSGVDDDDPGLQLLDDSLDNSDDYDDDLPVGSYPNRPTATSAISYGAHNSDIVNYPKMNEIFKYYWDLELDGSVSLAYFGRINENNYRDFGIQYFEGTFNNLSYIKEKLDSRAYFNNNDFIGDFEIMFNQIRSYFAEKDDILLKTDELQNIFIEKKKSIASAE